MKYISKLNILFLIIILLLAGMLVLNFYNPPLKTGFYCGVVSVPYDQPILISANSTGEMLYKGNCKSCHKLHEESVGPALSGITERRSKKWIYAFVQNSRGLINKGDTMAINVYNKYNKAEMTSFPTFTKAEIDSILMYIEHSLLYIPKK